MADSVKCVCRPVGSGKNKKCPKCHPNCICEPKHSGDNPTCRRCHPHTWMNHTRLHDVVHPAERKQHEAIPTGQLSWLQVPDEEAVPSESEDQYADFVE